LNDPYISEGSAGDTKYLQMSANDQSQFRIGHQILIRCTTDFTLDVNAKVTESTAAAGNSYLTVTLLEDDDNSTQGNNLADADTVMVVFCGSGALLGINRLAKAGSHFTMTSVTKAYGIQVTEWVTPFGTLYLKTHPLMSQEPTTRYGMLIVDPKNVKYRYITDTKFYAEGEAAKAGPGTQVGRIDATTEEFLTEAGLELHHPYTHMYLNGVGENSAV